MKTFLCIVISLLVGFSAGYQKKKKKYERKISELELLLENVKED